jgi:hypothetical protein
MWDVAQQDLVSVHENRSRLRLGETTQTSLKQGPRLELLPEQLLYLASHGCRQD